jgi:hypothetical protein
MRLREVHQAILTLVAAFSFAVYGQQQDSINPTSSDVQVAMKKATTFMVERVAYRGGYVWSVSEDFSRRYGEIPARSSQIWVQDGTPLVGMALLDAYDLTGDRYYLEAARKAADALVYGQHPLGGWHYFVDFDPKGIKQWYDQEASRFKWGMEEYRHYYGNATFDDANTASATRFLLRLYTTTHDPAFRRPLLKALNFIVVAQYPNGAWPQRYPLSHEFSHDGFPDYTSYYTLNDGSAASNIDVLVEAYEKLGNKRYLASAKRGIAFMMLIQGPNGQAAWAEQYDPKTMLPVKARTHEPAGYVIRESIQVIDLLEKFYEITGDRSYLKPIPGCLAWFDRVNREAVELKRPPARYYEVGTNLPIYNLRTDKTNAEGYGLYRWSSKDAEGDGFGLFRFNNTQPTVRPVVDVVPIRQKYEQVASLSPAQARAKYQSGSSNEEPRERARRDSVAQIINAMDSRGAWIRDDLRVLTVVPRSQGINPGSFETMRGYSTAVFVRNLRALIAYCKTTKESTQSSH